MGSRGRASDVKGEEEELLPPLTFASSILREPFVQDIIIENEMMLGEVTRLRLLRERYMEESRQHVNTAETAGRQLLAAREAERRVELCVWWQTFILSGLRDALEELETAQEEIAALQKVMLSVQEELGAVEQHSPLVSSEGELTPARVITAADLGSKLHANYTRLSNYGGGSYSPRVSLGHTRKRRRSSGGGDGWLLTLSETPGEEQSVSQQPT